MINYNRQNITKMLSNRVLEVIIKIVQDNNVEQALRVLKENSKRWFF